jgi:hypothetical protein
MKLRNIGLGLFLAFLPIILFTLFVGCKKTATPLGANAPMGLDIPTYTPTPVAGAIEVYVVDGTQIQGVTVFVVDPTGNTLPSAITQPTVGYAAFNPANTKPGVWTAFVPSQPVSYVTNPGGANSTTINNYYYNSYQTFNVNSVGVGSVTFQNNGDSIYLEPLSIVNNGTFPNNYPVTAIYQNNGNLNKPVSVSFTDISGPSVFGEGVSIYPTALTLTSCTFQPTTITMTADYFTGVSLLPAMCPVKKSWTASISLYYCFCGGNEYYPYSFGISSSGDCGTQWTVCINNENGTTCDYLNCCGVDETNGNFWTNPSQNNTFSITNGSYYFTGSFTAIASSNPITIFSQNF